MSPCSYHVAKKFIIKLDAACRVCFKLFCDFNLSLADNVGMNGCKTNVSSLGDLLVLKLGIPVPFVEK